LRTMSAPVWWLQLQMHIQPPPAPVSPPFISEDPLGENVQLRGEKAVTLRVPEILPAEPVVTNIRGSI